MKSDFQLLGSLSIIDLFVFGIILLVLIGSGVWASRKSRSTNSYFLADRNLPWWSVAGSIYGTNVSLSQIIGMLGIGYSIGFAQSHYELLAIPAILLLCHLFIPAYRKKEIFTLSAFLGDRYNETARVLYTIIILSIIIILLVGGLYIGSRQLGLLFSGTALQPGYGQGILIIAAIACMLVFFGGMHAVVAAENIITLLMVIAVITVGVCTLSQPEIGGLGGLLDLDASSRGMNKMKLYLPSDHPDLPWTGVFSGLLVLHSFFWTTNQFEVQRALAARSNKDAQLGALAAGFLKLTIPFFSISAGVAAAYLFKYKYHLEGVKPDDAFMYLLGQVVPGGYGLLGLILAGFIGAIFSSIYSMLNSLSTVTAIDIYQRYVQKDASESKLLTVGRLSVLAACFIAVVMAWWSFNPDSDGNFFLTLSRNTSYLKPGIVSAFFLGVLWKRTHPISAGVVILAAPVFSIGIEWLYDYWLTDIATWRDLFGIKLNFMHRVFVVFVLCVIIQVLISLWLRKGERKSEELMFASGFRLWRVALLILLQLAFVGILYVFEQDAHVWAVPAALVVFGLLIDFSQFRNTVRFWSATLLSVTIWSLYYFA